MQKFVTKLNSLHLEWYFLKVSIHITGKKAANAEFTSQDFKIYEMCMNLQHTCESYQMVNNLFLFFVRENEIYNFTWNISSQIKRTPMHMLC